MIILSGLKARDALEQKHAKSIAAVTSAKKHSLAIINTKKCYSNEVFTAVKKEYLSTFNIDTKIFSFNSDVKKSFLLNFINDLNNDPKYTGILVQLPLGGPDWSAELCNQICLQKDVDGLKQIHLGALMQNNFTAVMPAVVSAVKYLLEFYKIDVVQKKIVILNNGFLIGWPLSVWFSYQGATVSVLNAKTLNLVNYCQNSDIIVTATGVPNLINQTHVNKNTVLIDLGIAHLGDKKIVGDVNFSAINNKCFAVTPVPKGIGPLTLFALLMNFIKLYPLKNN